MKFSTTLTDFAKKTMEIKHPIEEDLGFLYGAILTDGKDDFDENKGTHNICVFADRQVFILFFTFNFQLIQFTLLSRLIRLICFFGLQAVRFK